MQNIEYKGKTLVPSQSAMREMSELGLTISDCKHILENGQDAPRRRAWDCEEKWFGAGNKIYNVVIISSYSCFNNEEIYLIKHVGKFTK